MGGTIAILSALPLELRGACRRLLARAVPGPRQRWETAIAGIQVVLCAGGVGREAAQSAAETLCAERPRCLLAVGLAGGLDPSLAPGMLVVPRAVRTGPPARWHDAAMPEIRCDPHLVASVAGTLATHRLPCVMADCLSVARPIRGPAQKRTAWNSMAAAVCDMETYWVAGVAEAHGIPFAAVRAVADPAWRSLPPWIPADGRPAARALLAGAARHPWTLATLALLAVDTLRAARALERALPAWLTGAAAC